MSRRRASYIPATSLTEDEILDLYFGQRVRAEQQLVDGCSAPCCAPGRWDAVEEAEAGLRHALWLWTSVSLGFSGVVVTLAWLAWRWLWI